jgi:hypothetical protein
MEAVTAVAMESPSADTPATTALQPGDGPEQDPVQPEQEEAHPHNFAVQKDQHRLIRNDPDYDDWEYGTEPLPQEAWPTPSADASSP